MQADSSVEVFKATWVKKKTLYVSQNRINIQMRQKKKDIIRMI